MTRLIMRVFVCFVGGCTPQSAAATQPPLATTGLSSGDGQEAPTTSPAPTRASTNPALENTRKELEVVFAERIRATREKDLPALIAQISPDYSAEPQPGQRLDYEQICTYLRRGIEQFIEVRDLSITIENLELRGPTGGLGEEVLVDARQRFARTQRLADGLAHEVYTTVLQEEIWVRNAAGWQLRSVTNLREQQFLVDGEPVGQ